MNSCKQQQTSILIDTISSDVPYFVCSSLQNIIDYKIVIQCKTKIDLLQVTSTQMGNTKFRCLQ